MRIGVLSDTHLHSVTPLLRRIHKEYLSDVDAVFHAGDVVSVEVVKFLDHGAFYGVHGNMDPPDVRDLLPPVRIIELAGRRIGLTHGGGSPSGLEERVIQQFPDVDVIVYGHSHRPVNHIRNGILCFNPGTATGFSRNGEHTIGILELGDTLRGRIVVVEDL
jgi:uncharacterized protein